MSSSWRCWHTSAWVNVVLAGFTVIPAAPLDDGRLLRAAVWAWRGDPTTAIVWAARADWVFGFLLIGLGRRGVARRAGQGEHDHPQGDPAGANLTPLPYRASRDVAPLPPDQVAVRVRNAADTRGLAGRVAARRWSPVGIGRRWDRARVGRLRSTLGTVLTAP